MTSFDILRLQLGATSFFVTEELKLSEIYHLKHKVKLIKTVKTDIGQGEGRHYFESGTLPVPGNQSQSTSSCNNEEAAQRPPENLAFW